MSSINEMIARVERLNIEQLCEDAFNLNSEIAEDLNREQLNEGVTSDERWISPFYRPATLHYKEEVGQQMFPMNLRDSGDFHNEIVIQAAGGVISSISRDWKFETLANKWGENILGLSKSSIIELNKVLQPTLVEEVKKDLGI
jgi:hypothetical protein